MESAHQARLDRIVNGDLPAGSGDARTLGIMLLAEVLSELRAIRAALASESEPSAPRPTYDPSAMMAGRLADVRRAITDCDNAGALARCLQIEQARAKPRSTILSAIRSRIQTLA